MSLNRLKALRMPDMRMAFQDVADLARQESLTLEHFLFMLVGTEQQSRTQNRVECALRASPHSIRENPEGL